jgi:spermidine-citrate ligase
VHVTQVPPAAAPPADARTAAVTAATQTLLNCYLREGGEWHADGDVAVLPLRDLGCELHARFAYRSRTHGHRWSLPVLIAPHGGEPRPVAFHTLACLLIDALGGGAPAALLERMLDSVRRVGDFLELRADAIERLWSADPLEFAASERALLLGHMLHPTPKSRAQMAGHDHSPEALARFRLHWLAVAPELVVHDSAGEPAPLLVERLLAGTALPDRGRRVLLPAHPWELGRLRRDDRVAALLASGRIVDLGPHGAPVTPTSSVRTVYAEVWPWQLKFSLHVQVTNSMRVILPKELRRAVEAARLAQTEIGERTRAVAPAWVTLHDPAFLSVVDGDGPIDGLSVLLRENRWPAGSGRDASALTVLCQDHPYGGRSRLGRIVERLARASGRTEGDVAREWFARYCDVFVVSVLRLYLDVGLCFEPHQQNVLLELEGGWPARAVCRDSQGYFHRALAHDDIAAVIPRHGEASESIFPEALADERLSYYAFVNNALGVVNALGVAGCADEDVLLADLRRVVEGERARGGRYPATWLDRLLDEPEWPCKANLRTRIHDMDELVGDIATQSVYVRVPNPLGAA